jgi:hypothetical protein
MNKFGSCLRRLHCLLFIGFFAVSVPAFGSDLLFSDDFGSGDLSTHNDHFRWGSGSMPSEGSGSGRIFDVVGPQGVPVKALRFRYTGFNDGGSGDAAKWAEQRFSLTRSITDQRTSNDSSDVAHPEVWISFWMHVPGNYFHMMRDGRPSGDNQKGWLYLWKDGYERWNSKWEDEEVTPTAINVSWWPLSDESGTLNYGMSRVSITATSERNGWGHNSTPSFLRQNEAVVGREDRPYSFLRNEFGTWVHYTYGVRVASTPGVSGDGFFRMYKNGELAVAWEGLNNGSPDRERNGFDRGYLMGYHNTGYDETTDYFITDFKIGLTKDSVLTDFYDAYPPVKPKPPTFILAQ